VFFADVGAGGLKHLEAGAVGVGAVSVGEEDHDAGAGVVEGVGDGGVAAVLCDAGAEVVLCLLERGEEVADLIAGGDLDGAGEVAVADGLCDVDGGAGRREEVAAEEEAGGECEGEREEEDKGAVLEGLVVGLVAAGGQEGAALGELGGVDLCDQRPGLSAGEVDVRPNSFAMRIC
jgi:hypothetical protein